LGLGAEVRQSNVAVAEMEEAVEEEVEEAGATCGTIYCRRTCVDTWLS